MHKLLRNMKSTFDSRSLSPGPNVALPTGGASREAVGLEALLTLINDPERAPVEGAAPAGNLRVEGVPKKILQPEPTLQRLVARVTQPAGPAPTKVFFTGRVGVGKDYLAKAISASVFAFADPLYGLVRRLYELPVSADAESKKAPGVRETLQRLGQYGRGTVNSQYPLTPERALIINFIRRIGPECDSSIDWDTFGRDEDIWLNACIRRVEVASMPLSAIVGVRFVNEYKRLTELGWRGFHIMASDATLAERRGPGFSPAAANDISEQLAKQLDQSAVLKFKQPGGKLRVIWSDSAAAPSNRLLTIGQFQAIFKI